MFGSEENVQKSKAVRITLVTVVLICACIVVAWQFRDTFMASNVAPLQPTVQWNSWMQRIPPGETADHLMSNDPMIPTDIRPSIVLQSRRDGQELLLQHNYGTEAFLYSSGSKSIDAVTADERSIGSGRIANCRSQLDRLETPGVTLSFYPTYQLSIHGNPVRAYGEFVLFVLPSPSKRQLAILSAQGPLEGPSTTTIMGGASDPIVHGRRYVQILNLDTQEFTKDPTRLEGQEDRRGRSLCWSDDEKYVVAYIPYENFSIIEVLGTN